MINLKPRLSFPQASFISQKEVMKISSTCTGASTTELAAAIVTNVINKSGKLAAWKHVEPVSCCDLWMKFQHWYSSWSFYPFEVLVLCFLETGKKCLSKAQLKPRSFLRPASNWSLTTTNGHHRFLPQHSFPASMETCWNRFLVIVTFLHSLVLLRRRGSWMLQI